MDDIVDVVFRDDPLEVLVVHHIGHPGHHLVDEFTTSDLEGEREIDRERERDRVREDETDREK
jgi:hypothetical protein